MQYRNLIDLIDCSSNTDIGLCWYKKGANNKWIYNLTINLMIELETIIALAFVAYIVNLDAYELHLGGEKSSMTILMNARILHVVYDKSSSLFNHIYFYSCK